MPRDRIIGKEVRRLSPEELSAIRRDRMMAVMAHEAQDFYSELLLSGSPDGKYDPYSVIAVFPVESANGGFTTDLVEFTREGAAPDEEYLRKIADLTLDGTTFATAPAAQLAPGMDAEASERGLMRELSGTITPSGVLVFHGPAPETASAHLFYPVYLSPSKSLAQIKDMAATALSQGSS